ncbi:MAG: DUF3298 domain-containing protein [Pseudoflavonifractor sp.]
MNGSQKPQNIPAAEVCAWRRSMKSDGEPVLTLCLRLPKFSEETPALRRMERYYRALCQRWRTRWEDVLFPRACAALAAAREGSRPFRPWEATLDFTVTRSGGGVLSLYLDARELCGGGTLTVRQGDTWDLASGTPCVLADFLPGERHRRRRILTAVAEQIAARIASGESLFFESWQRAAERGFDPRRFYLTQEHIAVFYPLCTLAPRAEGIPVFMIPLPAVSDHKKS